TPKRRLGWPCWGRAWCPAAETEAVYAIGRVEPTEAPGDRRSVKLKALLTLAASTVVTRRTLRRDTEASLLSEEDPGRRPRFSSAELAPHESRRCERNL